MVTYQIPRLVYGKPVKDRDGGVLSDYRITARSSGFPDELVSFWKFFEKEHKHNSERLGAPIGLDPIDAEGSFWPKYPWRERGRGGLVCLPVLPGSGSGGAGGAYMLIVRTRGRYDQGELAIGGRSYIQSTVGAVPLEDWRPWMLSSIARNQDLLPNPTVFGSAEPRMWEKALAIEPAIIDTAELPTNVVEQPTHFGEPIWSMIEAVVTNRAYLVQDGRPNAVEEHFDRAMVALSGVPLAIAQQIGVGAGLLRVPECQPPFSIQLSSAIEIRHPRRPALVNGTKQGDNHKFDAMVRYVEMLRTKIGETPSLDCLSSAAVEFSGQLSRPIAVRVPADLDPQTSIRRLFDDLRDQLAIDALREALRLNGPLGDRALRVRYRRSEAVQCILSTILFKPDGFNYDGFEQILEPEWADAWLEAAEIEATLASFLHLFGRIEQPDIGIASTLSDLVVPNRIGTLLAANVEAVLERDFSAIVHRREWDERLAGAAKGWRSASVLASPSRSGGGTLVGVFRKKQQRIAWLLLAADSHGSMGEADASVADRYDPLDLLVATGNAAAIAPGDAAILVRTATECSAQWVLEKWLRQKHSASRSYLTVCRVADEWSEAPEDGIATRYRALARPPSSPDLVKLAMRVAEELGPSGGGLAKFDRLAAKAVCFAWQELPSSVRNILGSSLSQCVGSGYAEALLSLHPIELVAQWNPLGEEIYSDAARGGIVVLSTAWIAWCRWTSENFAEPRVRDLIGNALVYDLQIAQSVGADSPLPIRFLHCVIGRGEYFGGTERMGREDRDLLRAFLSSYFKGGAERAFGLCENARQLELLLDVLTTKMRHGPALSSTTLANVISDEPTRTRIAARTLEWSTDPLWRLIHQSAAPRRLDRREFHWLAERRDKRLLFALATRRYPVGELIASTTVDKDLLVEMTRELQPQQFGNAISVISRRDGKTMRNIFEICLERIGAEGAYRTLRILDARRSSWLKNALWRAVGLLQRTIGTRFDLAARVSTFEDAALACAIRIDGISPTLPREIADDLFPSLKLRRAEEKRRSEQAASDVDNGGR